MNSSNKKLDWKPIARRRLESFSFFNINEVKLGHPTTGEAKSFYQLDARDWVNVFAFTEKSELVVIELFRFGTLARSVETPGGVVEEGESFESAASRELLEETGYKAGRLVALGSLHPNPAVNTNAIHYFLATELNYKGQEPDPDEVISVRAMPLSDFERRILEGQVRHSLVVSGYFLLRQKLKSEARKGNVLLPGIDH